jgi:hypothetical protein
MKTMYVLLLVVGGLLLSGCQPAKEPLQTDAMNPVTQSPA